MRVRATETLCAASILWLGLAHIYMSQKASCSAIKAPTVHLDRSVEPWNAGCVGTLPFAKVRYFAKKIAALPDWPTDRDFTATEWKQYVDVSKEIVTVSANDIELMLYATVALQVYEKQLGPSETGIQAMILLRVIFDIPESELEKDPGDGEVVPVLSAGGFNYHLVARPMSRMIGLPVLFRDGKLSLWGYRDTTGGIVRGVYDPLEEWRYFVKHFRRRDLSVK